MSSTENMPDDKQSDQNTNELWSLNIDDLSLSVRTANTLKAYGIFTVKNLYALRPGELTKIPNLGPLSRDEIDRALAKCESQLASKKKTVENCGSCKFWLDLDDDDTGPQTGLCRRFPPVRNLQPDDDETHSLELWSRPTTDRRSWCGEFKFLEIKQ